MASASEVVSKAAGGRAWLRGALALVVGYVGLCGVARASYRQFVYPAPPPATFAAVAGEELLGARASDGVEAHALWFAPRSADARVIAYFHGNGEIADADVPLARRLAARGFGVLLVEYRGYGASARSGPPSEAGLYADADAELDAIARRGVTADRVALWGWSLGTGVAAEMARRGRGSALVLVSPFTSVTAVAARVPWAWWLPTSLLVPDRFDTLSKAPDIHVPTLIAHGDRDSVIPFDMGRTLARAIAGARFFPVHGADHVDVYAVGGAPLMEAIVEQCRAGHGGNAAGAP